MEKKTYNYRKVQNSFLNKNFMGKLVYSILAVYYIDKMLKFFLDYILLTLHLYRKNNYFGKMPGKYLCICTLSFIFLFPNLFNLLWSLY